MEYDDPRRAFINEVWRRFEEVQAWAIEHWPQPQHPLSSSDFVETRKEILALGSRHQASTRQEPEPAEGGAQYIDSNPAPWP